MLIALGILGVIATFTIPKVLQSQQDGKYNAIAQEAIAMVSGAYEAYKMNNTPAAGLGVKDLTPYMNYVALKTTGTMDFIYTGGSYTCDATHHCLKLHNGGMLAYTLSDTIGNTNPDNAMIYYIDPDGRVTDGTTNGPGKAVSIYMYANGRVSSSDNIMPSTYSGGFVFNPSTDHDPPWFS